MSEVLFEMRFTGHPEPGGSKSAFPLQHRGTKRWLTDAKGRPLVNVVDANPNVKRWRESVAKQAMAQFRGRLLTGPLIAEWTFYLHRWKSHYGSGANARILRASAPIYPGGDHPDTTKLLRAAEDALSGVVWTDDALITDQVARRRYVEGYCLKDMPGEGVEVRVLRHRYATLGERAEAAQGVLVAV